MTSTENPLSRTRHVRTINHPIIRSQTDICPSRPPEMRSSGLEEHAANGENREDDIDLPREDDRRRRSSGPLTFRRLCRSGCHVYHSTGHVVFSKLAEGKETHDWLHRRGISWKCTTMKRERERERERVISDIANGDDNVVDTRKRGEKNDREKKRRSEGIYAELATKE